MWRYEQKTGNIFFGNTWLGTCYSGAGEGKNNPAMQNIHNVGPIPCGMYTIGKAYGSTKTGPLTIELTPDASNEMFGRSEFRIHGDNKAMNGTASEGCIIASLGIRVRIIGSGDSGNRLEVVSGE